MVRIGRNEKCPCRSGKKYKYCCAQKGQGVQRQMSPEATARVTLMAAVKEIQADAEKRKQGCRELGVFFFYATDSGDAWVLEMTDCDCIKVAEDGKPLDAPIDENSETIEIDWTYTFEVKNKQLELTAYGDKKVHIEEDAPTRELSVAMRRIRKRFSQEQLDHVHISRGGR